VVNDEAMPISALEHHLYCPRQCALIHVEGLWIDNEHTVRGARGHRRADEGRDRRERGRSVLRGLPLWSERWNLVGRADIVEVYEDGRVVPVEYKIGHRHGETAAVQLCAQAFCLEEMFRTRVRVGYVWYARFRHRDEIRLDTALRATTARAISEIRANMAARSLPPAMDDARCNECQLADVCMPSVVAHPNAVTAYVERLACVS
jgi:CRISPR-associated exonuclease Cas4